MQFRKIRQEEASIELTPFIDVVLMLLLFFVVSSNLSPDATAFEVELPSVKVTEGRSDHSSIEIRVDAQGHYFLNGKPIGAEVERLKGVLQQEVEKEAVFLRVVGDRMAPYQAVMNALAVVQECGIKQVQIIAQKSA